MLDAFAPFGYRTAEALDDEYRVRPCPLLPGAGATTAMACTHHMVVFGSDCGHLHFHAIKTEGGILPSDADTANPPPAATEANVDYPTISPEPLKAISIAPAGIASSAVRSLAFSPCHSRLACVTLDGTVHLLQLYYSVAVAGGGGGAGVGAPVLLDVKRIGAPIALPSVGLTVQNPPPPESSLITPRAAASSSGLVATLSPSTTPRARPATRKTTLTPSSLASALLWADGRTVLVGCTRHAAVVAVCLSRGTFLSNVWIPADGTPPAVEGNDAAGAAAAAEAQRTKGIIAADSAMPIALKVVLLTYDAHDASPLLQLQLRAVVSNDGTEESSERGGGGAEGAQRQVLVVTTELRTSLVTVAIPAATGDDDDAEQMATNDERSIMHSVANSTRGSLCLPSGMGPAVCGLIDYSAEALLGRAYEESNNSGGEGQQPPPAAVIWEIDPPVGSTADRLISKASSLWRDLRSGGGSDASSSHSFQSPNASTSAQSGAAAVALPLFGLSQIGQRPRDEGYFGATAASAEPVAVGRATLTPQGRLDPAALPSNAEGPNPSMRLRLPYASLAVGASSSSSSSSQQLTSESHTHLCTIGGAALAASVRVYAARHNQRVFEADPLSGRVLKTLRYEPRPEEEGEDEANPYASMEEVPLGLLDGLPARLRFGGRGGADGTAASAAVASGNEGDDASAALDHCFVWSEAPTFAAVVRLSGTAGCQCVWAMVTEEPPEEGAEEEPSELCFDIVSSCAFRHNQFRFVLCSTNVIMTVPILARPRTCKQQEVSSAAVKDGAVDDSPSTLEAAVACPYAIFYVVLPPAPAPAPQPQPLPTPAEVHVTVSSASTAVSSPTAPRSAPRSFNVKGGSSGLLAAPTPKKGGAGGGGNASATASLASSPVPMSAGLGGGGTAADADGDDDASKKKKKKLVVVKKVVKKKGGVVVGTTKTAMPTTPRGSAVAAIGASPSSAAAGGKPPLRSAPIPLSGRVDSGASIDDDEAAASSDDEEGAEAEEDETVGGAGSATPSPSSRGPASFVSGGLGLSAATPVHSSLGGSKQKRQRRAEGATAAAEGGGEILSSAPLSPSCDAPSSAPPSVISSVHGGPAPSSETVAIAEPADVAPVETTIPLPAISEKEEAADAAEVVEAAAVVEETPLAATPAPADAAAEPLLPTTDSAHTTTACAVVETDESAAEADQTELKPTNDENSAAAAELQPQSSAANADGEGTAAEEEGEHSPPPRRIYSDEAAAAAAIEKTDGYPQQPLLLAVGNAEDDANANEEGTSSNVVEAEAIALRAESDEQKSDAANNDDEVETPQPLPSTPDWPADTAAARLYDVTDRIFRSYAANSLDAAYHCPLLTNIFRRLLPLYEYVAAEHVAPAVGRKKKNNNKEEGGGGEGMRFVSHDLAFELEHCLVDASEEDGKNGGSTEKTEGASNNNKEQKQWSRRYAEQQDALRLFGLPTSHAYPSEGRALLTATTGGRCSKGGPTTSTGGSGSGNNAAHQHNHSVYASLTHARASLGATLGGGGSCSSDAAAARKAAATNVFGTYHPHTLHSDRFQSAVFSEWAAALLGAALQWSLHTDIDEDPTDAADGAADFWRFDFERERANNANSNGNDPSAHEEWLSQWLQSCGEAYVPFHYSLASSSSSLLSPSSAAVPPALTTATGLGVGEEEEDLASYYSRPAPSALLKGSVRAATVLEHQAYAKALLGRSRVVVALRLLRAARLANVFSANLPRDLERIERQCFARGRMPNYSAAMTTTNTNSTSNPNKNTSASSANFGLSVGGDGDDEASPERALARRRCETRLLNALLASLRNSASDMLEALATCFPALVGCGLLEPAGRRMMDKADEYYARMLNAVGFRSDDAEGGGGSGEGGVSPSSAGAEVDGGAAGGGGRVSDAAVGLFVPAVAGRGHDLVGASSANSPSLSPSSPAPQGAINNSGSAGTRVLSGAMERLALLLRPMRMDMAQREALVLEEVTAQAAAEMELLRHLIMCGVFDEEAEADIGGSQDDLLLDALEAEEEDAYYAGNANNNTQTTDEINKQKRSPLRLLPFEEAAAYRAAIGEWCYGYWAEQCRRIDSQFAALCDPLLSALDVPRMAGGAASTAAASVSGAPSLSRLNCAAQPQLWASEVLGALSRQLRGLHACPPFPQMSSNFDLRDWYEAQQRVCDEMTLIKQQQQLQQHPSSSPSPSLLSQSQTQSQHTERHRRFTSRKFQLVTSPVALALLNRDASAVVELLSCAFAEEGGVGDGAESSAAWAYKREWVFASRPRSMSSSASASFHNAADATAASPLLSAGFGGSANNNNSNPFHAAASTQYEAQRRNATISFNHSSVPQLLHYLPYLSVAFPSKLAPLVIDAFPAISARALYPSVASRNRRVRPNVSMQSQRGVTDTSSPAEAAEAADDAPTDGRTPLGGSPMRYDCHQAAAAVMNYWLLKAEHEEEIVAEREAMAKARALAAMSRNASGRDVSPNPQQQHQSISNQQHQHRSGRSVTSRRGPHGGAAARDTSSLLKLITSTAPFETQSRQDLLDELCQCVLVVAQQKGQQVMELLTAATLSGQTPAVFGATANNRMGNHSHSQQQSSANNNRYFNNVSPNAPSAAQFNKSLQGLVRGCVKEINAAAGPAAAAADPAAATRVALKGSMRLVEAATRFLVSFASSRSYWATGAATKWSPLTVLSAALERRRHLLEELGDERDSLEALLHNGADAQGPSSSAALHEREGFDGNGGGVRSSAASVGDFGFTGGKPTTAPSFFGGLLRKASAKGLSGGGGGKGSAGQQSQDRPIHLDPIYANIGAFATATKAQSNASPAVRHHYNQLLQTQRKIVRVEDSIMVFLSSASLCLADAYHAQFAAAIADSFGAKGSASSSPAQQQQQLQPVEVLVSAAFYPEILRLLDVYVFPRAVLDLDLVGCFIADHAKRRAVADLLPLFQTDSGFAGIGTAAAGQRPAGGANARAANVNLFTVASTATCRLTEQHWLSLLQLSHANGCLEAAMAITMTVFAQQPKKARYLLRRAFPLLDFPDQLDPEVRRVAAKFAPILGLNITPAE